MPYLCITFTDLSVQFFTPVSSWNISVNKTGKTSGSTLQKIWYGRNIFVGMKENRVQQLTPVL
jgi:hypothetical protein